MNAIVVREDGSLAFERVADPQAGPGEVVVELRAAALNHRDLFVRARAGDYGAPFVPGSDGAGIRRDTGEEVVVFPSLDWGEREEAPGPGFRILGGPDDGTFAELVKVPAENLFPRPRGLSWEEAAALPLGGLTAHRALFARAGLRAGETALVLGIGGGVATLALQLARAAGARVLVTSSSPEKLARATELGAAGGVDYTGEGWVEEVRELAGGEGVDVVVDSVGSTWPDALRCLRPGGRLVAFGATGGAEVPVPVRAVFWGQHSLLGTTMGSARDFSAMLALVERGGFAPVVDSVRPLAEAGAALERLERSEQFGKLVLAIPG